MGISKNWQGVEQITDILIGSIASFMWGVIFCIFAILYETWVSHIIAMTLAIIGTLLCAISLIAVCSIVVSVLHKSSKFKNQSTFALIGNFKDYPTHIESINYFGHRGMIENHHLN